MLMCFDGWSKLRMGRRTLIFSKSQTSFLIFKDHFMEHTLKLWGLEYEKLSPLSGSISQNSGK